MEIKNLEAKFTYTGEPELILTLPKSENRAVEQLLNDYKTKPQWTVEIKPKTKKRSLDANAYLWVIADKMAEKLQTTKELVYQEAVKKVGVFETLLLQDKAVDNFINMWKLKGLGYYAEESHKSKAVEGCTVVRAYWGSHLYDSKQMARLIDHLVEEAKEQGVETMTPDELAKLKNAWKG